MEHEFKNAKTPPRFSYQRNPHHDRSFMILEHAQKKGYEPVGDYTVLDLKEEIFLSEKKVMNLVSLLNDQIDTLDLSQETSDNRMFYYEAPNDDKTKHKVIFYNQNGTGVSQESAMFLINKEVWGNA